MIPSGLPSSRLGSRRYKVIKDTKALTKRLAMSRRMSARRMTVCEKSGAVLVGTVECGVGLVISETLLD